jgi:hypothetical protein
MKLEKNCIQCPPLKRITLSERENNNRMIQLANIFVYCLVLRYIMEPDISDYNMQLMLFSVILFKFFFKVWLKLDKIVVKVMNFIPKSIDTSHLLI